jgi:hypothetical protein
LWWALSVEVRAWNVLQAAVAVATAADDDADVIVGVFFAVAAVAAAAVVVDDDDGPECLAALCLPLAVLDVPQWSSLVSPSCWSADPSRFAVRHAQRRRPTRTPPS